MLIDPTLDQMLDFCARDPIERVFLEDAARRGHSRFRAVQGERGLDALCYFGANVVPSGRGCGAFAADAASRMTRMIIGEEEAVGELWSAARSVMPRPREDRPGQPVYVLDEAPPPGSSGLRAAQLEDLDILVPACALTHEEELGVDPLRRDPIGFRRRTAAQIEEGARGSGRRARRSSSRPRRRPGRRAPSSSSRCGSIRRRGAWTMALGG